MCQIIFLWSISFGIFFEFMVMHFFLETLLISDPDAKFSYSFPLGPFLEILSGCIIYRLLYYFDSIAFFYVYPIMNLIPLKKNHGFSRKNHISDLILYYFFSDVSILIFGLSYFNSNDNIDSLLSSLLILFRK